MINIKHIIEKTYYFNRYNRKKWIKNEAKKIPSNSRVIDIGAGTGRYREYFGHCDYRTHDFEKTPELIGKYTKLDYVSDITDLPVEDCSFDVILCTEVLEHVPNPIKAINEMARILKPGGKIMISAPLASHLHQEPYIFYSGYTPYWYKKFLPEAGITIKYINSNRGLFSFLGQEILRLNRLLSPTNLKNINIINRIFLFFIWIATFPCLGLLLISEYLDSLKIEDDITVGYHLLGVKKEV